MLPVDNLDDCFFVCAASNGIGSDAIAGLLIVERCRHQFELIESWKVQNPLKSGEDVDAITVGLINLIRIVVTAK